MNSKVVNLEYNQKNYEVKINKKRMKSLRLKITQNGEITLNIPLQYSYEKAYIFLKDKASWIEKNINKIKNNKIDNECDFKEDSIIYIWGKPRKIVIVKSYHEDVELEDEILVFRLKNNEPSYVEKKFHKWAKSYFFGHLLDMYEIVYKNVFLKLKVRKPQLVIRTMVSMWGNCKYSKEVITLNYYLLKTPVECIEYIILHELAHMIYHDHGAEFKAFLTKYMPDWKTRKKLLNNYSLHF